MNIWRKRNLQVAITILKIINIQYWQKNERFLAKRENKKENKKEKGRKHKSWWKRQKCKCSPLEYKRIFECLVIFEMLFPKGSFSLHVVTTRKCRGWIIAHGSTWLLIIVDWNKKNKLFGFFRFYFHGRGSLLLAS